MIKLEIKPCRRTSAAMYRLRRELGCDDDELKSVDALAFDINDLMCGLDSRETNVLILRM